MVVRILIFLTVCLFACGGKQSVEVSAPEAPKAPKIDESIPKGSASPDALGQAIVDAVRNPEAIERLFPNDALLDLAVHCPGAHPMKLEMVKKKEKVLNQLHKTIPPEMGDVVYQSVEEARDMKIFKVGEKRGDCSFRLPVSMQRFRHTARTTMNGKPRPLKDGVEFLKIGDYGWYLYSL